MKITLIYIILRNTKYKNNNFCINALRLATFKLRPSQRRRGFFCIILNSRRSHRHQINCSKKTSKANFRDLNLALQKIPKNANLQRHKNAIKP